MKYSFNAKGNRKTALPTTTSPKQSCPDSCALKEKGCYAKYSFLGKHWSDLSEGKKGFSFSDMLEKIKALPAGQVWRHNQAGDISSEQGNIDLAELRALVDANKGKKGFTYTHNILNSHNVRAIKSANLAGFTINASTETGKAADKAFSMGLPVVTILPSNAPKVTKTPAGRKVVTCPADLKNVTCKTCKLCQRSNRDFIIGFRAHGSAKKSVEIIAKG